MNKYGFLENLITELHNKTEVLIDLNTRISILEQIMNDLQISSSEYTFADRDDVENATIKIDDVRKILELPRNLPIEAEKNLAEREDKDD